MTNVEPELLEVFERIQARERERLRDVERAAQRARDALYAVAEAACERAGVRVTSALRAYQRHVADLAAAATPPIALVWLAPGARSTALVRPRGALALHKGRTVVVPPITTDEAYVVVLHELGHLYGPRSLRRLEGEASAWRWARQHAVVWNRETQAAMTRSLASYIDGADDVADVLDVRALEALCTPLAFCRELQRRVEASLR